VGEVNGEEAYQAIDGVTSRGVEMEVTGEVMKDVKLSAGYTYTHARRGWQGCLFHHAANHAACPFGACKARGACRPAWTS
jgi:outer membrane receptor for ferrienterochelin and colicin